MKGLWWCGNKGESEKSIFLKKIIIFNFLKYTSFNVVFDNLFFFRYDLED